MLRNMQLLMGDAYMYEPMFKCAIWFKDIFFRELHTHNHLMGVMADDIKRHTKHAKRNYKRT